LPNFTWTLSSLVLVAAAAGAILAAVLFAARRLRESPEKREATRRTRVAKEGRITDGFIFDVNETTLFYQYAVNGINYETAQDISALLHQLPKERTHLIGPVKVKHLVRRPENSVVISEGWSGFG
jgi:hypothetical protein